MTWQGDLYTCSQPNTLQVPVTHAECVPASTVGAFSCDASDWSADCICSWGKLVYIITKVALLRGVCFLILSSAICGDVILSMRSICVGRVLRL